MRISDWSSDVCSSDLRATQPDGSEQSRGERCSHVCPACAKTMRFCPSCEAVARSGSHQEDYRGCRPLPCGIRKECWDKKPQRCGFLFGRRLGAARSRGRMCDWRCVRWRQTWRSEEHTSELKTLIRTSSAVFCV